MRLRLLCFSFAICAALTFMAGSADALNIITFDELSETGSGSFLANGYHGLNWNNIACANSILYPSVWGTGAVYYGMVSVSNVAVAPTIAGVNEISSGTNFDFLSLYLATDHSANVEVKGYRGTSLIYDETVSVIRTNPTFCTFNYLDVDRVGFSTPTWDNVVMDNITIQFIPEPSTVLLTGLGLLALATLLVRKRSSTDSG